MMRGMLTLGCWVCVAAASPVTNPLTMAHVGRNAIVPQAAQALLLPEKGWKGNEWNEVQVKIPYSAARYALAGNGWLPLPRSLSGYWSHITGKGLLHGESRVVWDGLP